MKILFPNTWIGPAGEDSSPKWFYSGQEILRKTQWLILWRLVFISFFLLLTVLLQEREGLPFFSLSRLFGLIALQYLLSILYIFSLFWGKFIPGNAGLQLLSDGLFVTAVVYLTGGIESFFPYLYFFIILAGGILFYRLGGLVTALYAALLYGLLLSLQGFEKIPFYYGMTGQAPHYSIKTFFYQIGMNGAGFLFVGYLSSMLAEQTRKQQNQIESQQKSIVQLEELNRIVIENLDIGLITLDHDNKIQSINPTGKILLGRPSEELRNLPLSTLFPDLEKDFGSGDTSSLVDRLETTYCTPEGLIRTLDFSFTEVQQEPSHGIDRIFSFKDISQLKIMEEHLRKVERLAMLGKMAAGIAHEIRNPLASISGSIQVLKDDFKEEGSGERLLKIISREVSKLDSLMNDFLTFAKPAQNGEARLDLSAFIPELIELVKKNREVPRTIRWELELLPNCWVNISEGEFSQVLWNLLMNAIQTLPADGVIVIETACTSLPFSGDWIQLTIKDNGPGISEKDQARIFEPFYTTKERGTGLGLSIVQKIISDRRGQIQVNSFPGQGAEFVILLPGSADRTLTKSGPLG